MPRPGRPHRLGRRGLGVLLALVLIGLGLGIIAGWMPGQAPRSEETATPAQSPTPPAPVPLTEAEAAWRKLQPRIDRPDGDAILLRRDLVGFRARFPHTPEARGVAEVLMRVPSSLDKLPLAKIPPKERFAW